NRAKTDFPRSTVRAACYGLAGHRGFRSTAGTVGITERTIGTVWQLFKNSEYGFARFEVSAPSVLPRQQRFRLTFRLLQWRWRLVAVTLPENIQNLLGDELAKALRTPVQNQ